MKALLPLMMIPALAGCQGSPLFASLEGSRSDAASGAASESGETVAPYSSTGEPWVLRPRARDGADAPQGTAQEATSGGATGGAGRLGVSVASLGAASEPGLWVKTPLVGTVRPGRVRVPATGREVVLELRPMEGVAGQGARLSLQAMLNLGLSLTALPEIEIYGG